MANQTQSAALRLLGVVSGCLRGRHRWGEVLAEMEVQKEKRQVVRCTVCGRASVRFWSDWLETWYLSDGALMSMSQASEYLERYGCDPPQEEHSKRVRS